MDAISKEPCPVWCFAYNGSFLVVVAHIIIDMFFSSLTLEHSTWCFVYVVGSLTNKQRWGEIFLHDTFFLDSFRINGKPGMAHWVCTPSP